MAFDVDEEILQDFLVEAGEILEQLSEQLVELEQNANDTDLLNAIFRGFHTVKGGAGFLGLTALVEVCHVAEDVFNLLRTGQRQVTAPLMDVILQALDTVNSMFDQIRSMEEPTPADPQLLAQIAVFAKPESEDAPAAAEPEPVAAAPEPPPPALDPEPEIIPSALTTEEPTAPAAEAPSGGDITDAEFEQLLDALEGNQPAAASIPTAPPPAAAPIAAATEAAPTATSSDEITEDEFEALLDELHGQGQFTTKEEVVASTPAPPVAPAAPAAGGKSDLITDSEFESLLDELHGQGQFSAATPAPALAAPAAPAPSAPAAPAPAKPAAAAPPPPPPPPPSKPAAPAAAAKPPDKPKAADKREGGGTQTETTVRVDTRRLDDIMNMVGELVLVRNRLVTLGINSENEEMGKTVANLDVVTANLQAAVMKTRMQPIKKVFGRFPRVVRDLARNLKKEVILEMQGEETDLDKNLVEALADPLVHLVRNAVDHGVESPEEREAVGKPRKGTVVLAAQQEGDHILLFIQDDGKGMDAEVLRSKVVEKGLMEQDAADRLTESDCYNLIFMPGFSTKQEISDVSGRGVGMDVVKTKIAQLNGSIEIDSTKGKGSRIAIKVPLTLAILPTLMVVLDEQTFALPLACVNEIFHLDLSKTNVIDGQKVIVVRDKALPLFYLKSWLIPGADVTQANNDGSMGHVVIVSVGNQRVGFVVDQLLGQEEVVIKPLGTMLHGTPGMAGATITGDGHIALILDVPGMLKHYARKHA